MAWRARTHHLTRNPKWLFSTALIILAAGLGLATLVVTATPAREDATLGMMRALVESSESQLREGYRKLANASQPDPRQLARWLRRACHLTGTTTPDAGHALGDFDTEKLLDRHSTDAAQRALFADYMIVAGRQGGRAEADAFDRLENAAEREPPPPLANQLLAQALVQNRDTDGALKAFIREGRLFEDAEASRAEALHWAVTLKRSALIKELLAIPGWTEGSDVSVVYHAAVLSGDVWLQWKSLLSLRLRNLPWVPLTLALLAIGLWYVILVQVSGWKHRWRWTLPMLPLMAGVISIWPTVSLVEFQDQHLGLSADAPFPHNLWYFYGGIALRENLCKLALFSLFLPWLLRVREARLALITGAFVGLGFALEENLDYYDPSGGSVVWSRFITANFMHASLTGIAALGLYKAVSSRFHRVADFVGAFLLVIAAHGTYDLVLVYDMPDVLGLGFFSIIVLAVLANHFFGALGNDRVVAAGPVSPGAVFVVGSAVLVAALFVAAAFMEGDMQSVAAVGQGCIAMVPVGFLFWRHLAP